MTRRTLDSRLVLVAALLVFLPEATAQVMDNPVAIPVTVHAQFTSSSSQTLTLTWYGETSLQSGDGSDDVTWSSNGSGTTQTDPQKIDVRPGKTYDLRLSGSASITGYTVELAGPPGYDFFISEISNSDPINRPLVSSGATLDDLNEDFDDYKIMVQPSGYAGDLIPFAQSTSWTTDKLVWKVGMGQLKNGSAAGAISIGAEEFASINFQPSDLYYSAPSTEVSVVFSGGVLRQVNAPQGLADIVTVNSTTYEIRYYSWKDVGPFSGGIYTLVGSPNAVATYRIYKAATNNIEIKKSVDSDYWITRLNWVYLLDSWEMHDWTKNATPTGNAMRKVITTNSTAGSTKTTVVSEYGRNLNAGGDYSFSGYQSTPSRRTRKTYTNYAWGWELTRLEEGWDGTSSALRTTDFEYYTSIYDGLGHYRQLKKVVFPDGGYKRMVYEDTFERIGLVKEIYEPFEDANEGKKTVYVYGPDFSGDRMLPTSIITRVKDSGGDYQKVGERSIAYNTSAITRNGEPVRQETITDYASSSLTEVTVRQVYQEDASDAYLRGQPYSIRNPDGTQVSFAYYTTAIYEYYEGAYVWRTYYVKDSVLGNSSSPSGETSSALSSLNGETIEAIYVIEKKSTQSGSWFDVGGVEAANRLSLNTTGTSFELASASSYGYDNAGRPTVKKVLTYANGALQATNTVYEATYVSGELFTETDEVGNLKSYWFDRQGRVEEIKTEGYSLDSGAGTPEVDDVWNSFRFDGANQRIRAERGDSGGSEAVVSSWTYDVAGRLTSKTLDCCRTVSFQYPAADQIKTINPDGGYKLEDFFRDGSLDSVTGDAQPPRYVRSRFAANQIEAWTALKSFTVGTYEDGWRIERFDWLGRAVEVEEPLWNASGGHPSRLTNIEYANGRQKRTYQEYEIWEEENEEYVLSSSGYPALFEYDGLGRLKRTALDANNNQAIDLATDKQIAESRIDFVEDASGYWWQSTRNYAYPTASSSTAEPVKEERIRLAPDANSLGRMMSIDLLGDEDTGSNGRPRATSILAVDRTKALVTETTSFDPYPTGDRVRVFKAGLLVKDTDPAGTKVEIDYDNLRRRYSTTERGSVKTLLTYESGSMDRVRYITRDYGAGTLTVRENVYNSTTGRLDRHIRRNKVYGTERSENTYYTYTKQGRVDYQYGDGAFPVDYVYNAYGQLVELHQYRNTSGTNKTTVKMLYDDESGLLKEKRHYSTSSAYKATKYEYNDQDKVSKRIWARSSGGTLKTTYWYDTTERHLVKEDYSDTTPDVTYTYDRMGRVETVIDAAGTRKFLRDSTYGNLITLEEDLDISGSGKFGNLTVRYPTEDGSGTTVKARPKGVELGTGTGGSFSAYQRQHYGYETTGGRISHVGTWTSQYNWYRQYDYTYHTDSNLMKDTTYSIHYKRSTEYESWRNNRSRQKTEFLQGSTLTVKSDFTVPVFTWQDQIEKWRLNGTAATDELTDHYGWSNTADVKQKYDLKGQVIERDYDWIGSSAEDTYTWDSAGNPTSFDGKGYSANGLNQIEPTGGGSSDFVYDDDGNLTGDLEWTYTYDAQNRLTRMVSKSGNAVHPKRLEFDYDYLHRRIEKRVYNATSGGTLTWQRRFVYDGSNVIAEVDASQNMVRSFHWGLDRASSLTATGGLEALLLITRWDGQHAYWPAYDLQSNVVGLINRSQAFEAAYQYDSFGAATKVGSLAYNHANPFRFATKYTDDESGLVYFGHRYYNPKTGRFINRDPIEEMGGFNLYRYTNNDAINRWDYLGLNPTLEPINKVPIALDEFVVNSSDSPPVNSSPYQLGVIGEPGISDFDDLYRAANGDPAGFVPNNEKDQKDQWSKEDCAKLKSDISRMNSELGQLLQNNGGQSFLTSNREAYVNTQMYGSPNGMTASDVVSLASDSLTISGAAIMPTRFKGGGQVVGVVSHVTNYGLAGYHYQEGNYGMALAHGVAGVTDYLSILSNEVKPLQVPMAVIDVGKAGIATASIAGGQYYRNKMDNINREGIGSYFDAMQGSETRRRAAISESQKTYNENCK
ncbi:MAG: RHS repeat-associated core domain-containing protein [Opitutaceae bacterium]